MKILLVITGLGMGGAEHVVSALADGLVAQQHSVEIVCLKGEVIVRPHNHQIKIHQLNLNSLAQTYAAMQKFKKIVQDFQPDVVHAHMFHAIIFTRLSRQFVPIKRLISNAHSKGIGSNMRALLYRYTDRFSEINSNVSHEATAYFIEQKVFHAKNSHTVTNGIDTQKFAPNIKMRQQLRQQFQISEQMDVFLAVGRFNPVKDYPNLLHAFAKYQQRALRPTQLFIVGDGEERAKIEALITQLQLQDSVMLLGIRHDVADLFNMADIFVLSSHTEGLSLVLAEAMATEKVVVATDCGGVAEVLAQPEYLVAIEDADALANKMLQATQLDVNQRLALGHANRQHIIAHYSVQTMVENWLKIYNS